MTCMRDRPELFSAPLLFAAMLALVTLATAAGADSALADDAAANEYTLTVYQIWGSNEKTDAKPPKELAPVLKKLTKKSKRKSFRLAAKPLVKGIQLDGKEVKAKLPSGYTATWRIEKRLVKKQNARKVGVRQELTNPKKKKAVAFFPKCPVIQEIPRIRDKSDASFILYLDFKKGKPKKP